MLIWLRIGLCQCILQAHIQQISNSLESLYSSPYILRLPLYRDPQRESLCLTFLLATVLSYNPEGSQEVGGFAENLEASQKVGGMVYNSMLLSPSFYGLFLRCVGFSLGFLQLFHVYRFLSPDLCSVSHLLSVESESSSVECSLQ